MIRFALGFAVALVVAFASQTAIAADTKETGELLVARKVTVNSTPATGGLTVISGSHIQTQIDGRAIVNLGKLGRIILGSESDLVLKFSAGKLSGDLTSGSAIINAPSGVEIAINTANGIVAADGEKASVMRIDLTGGTTRVESETTAKLTNGEKSEFVAAGEEIEFKPEESGIAIGRRPVESLPVTDVGGFGDVVASGIRGAIASLTLDRGIAISETSTRPTAELNQQELAHDAKDAQLVEQQVSCGDVGNLCTPDQFNFEGCQMLPKVIKAKAGCTLSFTLSTSNVGTRIAFTVRPFMSSACFRISPTYPQQVVLAPGESANGSINAKNCPKNAYQFAQNTLLVFESVQCGTQFVRVEWATPCI
jgi:hypothetical protein